MCGLQAAFQRAIDAEQVQALPSDRHLDACLGLVRCLLQHTQD